MYARVTLRPAIVSLLRYGMLALLVVFVRLSANSQTDHQPRLDLQTAVDKALANNPQTRIAASGLKIAELKIREAKAGSKPTFELTQNVIRSNNPVFVFGSLLEQGRFSESNFAINSLNHPDGLFNFRSQIEGRFPIFDQRQTRSNVSQAEIGIRKQQLAIEAVQQQLRFQVIRSFFGTIVAKQMVKVGEENVAAASENLRKTKDMVEVGMTTEADNLSAQVELASAEQQKLEAESGVVTSVAALNLTIGESLDVQRALTGELNERYFPVEEQAELIKLALENRPEYKQAELAIESSRVRTRAASGQKLPRVDAFGNFGYSSPYLTNGSTDYTVGISLSYNLFDAGRKPRIAQAVEAETLAEFEKEHLANQIRLEVIKAEQNFRTSRAKIAVAVKSIARSEEAVRIINDRYRVGLTTFSEVLRAQAAMVAAKQHLLQAKYEYIVSYASVLLATGRLVDVRAFD